MNYLRDVKDSVNAEIELQLNMEDLEKRVYQLTRDSTTIIGPPTSGARLFEERWIDSLWSIWICTVAGTPGTWRQITPAVVTSTPSGTIPNGYEIVRDDLGRQRFRYDGTSWVRVNRKTFTFSAPTDPWTGAHGLGVIPASVTAIVGGKEKHGGVTKDATNVTVNWGGNAQAGTLIVE